MPVMKTIYHKTDGAVEMRAAYVDDALAHPEEWSEKPWVSEEAKAEAPAPEEAPRRRRAASEQPGE